VDALYAAYSAKHRCGLHGINGQPSYECSGALHAATGHFVNWLAASTIDKPLSTNYVENMRLTASVFFMTDHWDQLGFRRLAFLGNISLIAFLLITPPF
jgi:hypothetical protein